MVCYIPTKNRFSTKTYELFQEAGIEVFHFIEPQDLDRYDVPNKISIEQNDQGIAFVRNFMIKHAQKSGHKWIIMCDDDVNGFGIFNGKTVKKGAQIWTEIFSVAENLPFELIGINYVQHAWHDKDPISINRKLAEVCVLMNTEKITWSYNSHLVPKEDRDFALQAIQKGNGILRFNHFWFSCPTVGTNPGGLHEIYAKKNWDKVSALKMCDQWQDYVTLKKKGDRVDIKIDFKSLAKNYKKQYK